MTLDEMREMCRSQPYVYLICPRTTLPKGKTIRLFGPQGGPSGRICSVREPKGGGFEVLACFDSQLVLRALDRVSG